MSTTTPFWTDGLRTIYNADCRDVLPLDGKADIVITDPPYAVKWSAAACAECGNDTPTSRFDVCADCIEHVEPGHRPTEMLGFVSPNWSEKATHSRGYADHDSDAFHDLLTVAWTGVRGSLAPGGLAIAFCGNRTFHEMTYAATAVGFQVLDVLVFVSNGGVAKSTTTLRPGHELAALMRLPGPVRHINPDWRTGNVFAIDKPRKAESEHLTTKPLAWMRTLVETFTEPGDVILDPFMGSGTTLRAAADLGRRAIGIEVDAGYCDVAVSRLAQQVLDLDATA